MDFLMSTTNPVLHGTTGDAPTQGLYGHGGNAGSDSWDPVEAYFECITTCSLEDGECVTQCVERLRSDSDSHD